MTSVRVLASIAAQKSAPAASRVAAANSLLEWGYGKPDQQHSLNAEISITIRKIFETSSIDEDNTKMIDVSPNDDNQKNTDKPNTDKQQAGTDKSK